MKEAEETALGVAVGTQLRLWLYVAEVAEKQSGYVACEFTV